MSNIVRRVTDATGITTPESEKHVYKSQWKPVPSLAETNVADFVLSTPVPDHKVLIVDGTNGRKTTKGELKTRVKQVAHSLRTDFKRKEGDAVCILSVNSDTFQLIVLGIISAGLIVTPANAAYGPEELEHQLQETGSITIFVHPAILQTALKAAKLVGWSEQEIKERIILAVYASDVPAEVAKAGFKTLDDLLKGKELDIVKVSNPKDRVAVMSFSSGTTGKAKAVQNTHYNMTSVLAINYVMPLGGDDAVHLGVLPFSHIYAFALNVLLPIYRGQTIVVIPRFEIGIFLENIQKYKCRNIWIVPPIALLLARDPKVANYNLDSVEFIISGAAPLGPDLQAELTQRLKNCEVSQGYGLSEMSPITHFCHPQFKKAGSIGDLLPNIEARLVDPATFKDVEGKGPQSAGELWVRGPTRMLGYLKRPQETAETIVENGWLRTGDVAYVDDDGHFWISDRIKELIKYKGFPVPPAELEALLLNHPKVKDSAVVPIYSEKEVTELPRAYVVLTPEAEKEDHAALEKEIVSWVQSKVAQHKRLRGGVKFITEIPKSPSGKILRRILRDQAKNEGQVKAKL